MSPILDWMHFGRHVAAELAGPWQATPGYFDHTVVVQHPDGRQILLSHGRTDERLYARGEFPADADHFRGTYHEISVRTDRGPAVLAAEITRRLLPAYGKDLAVAQAYLTEKKRNKAARAVRVQEIAAALTGDPRTPEHLMSDNSTTICWFWDQPGVHEIRVLGDGSRAEMTLAALPCSLVRRICDLIVGFEHDQAEPLAAQTPGQAGGSAA